jgi:predicted phage terminase large subunit-like protein
VTNTLPENKTKRELKVLRIALENDFLRFCRYFFKEVMGDKMIVSHHHKVLCDTLTKVYDGKIKRLVINLPPGYTKTETAVVHFIAWCMAKNRRSRFIHVTYADKLALENSTKVRDIILSPQYQELWPTELRVDTKAKGAWKNKKGGGLQARAAGGPITGFRAGQPEEGFSGAFIVDDPLKPDDATSEVTVERINDRFNKVFRSRLMKESETPMIVIMQRISVNDPSAYLLNGGMNCKWHHLNLPALIDPNKSRKVYSHAIPIDHKLPKGPLWDYKYDEKELENLRQADPYTYASQYDQDPAPLGGSLFKKEWLRFYALGSIIPEYMFITADTAQKTKQKNDYSVLQLWGVLEGNLYLLDQLRGKWEAPDLQTNFIAFWSKHFNPSSTKGKLRTAYIEDKSSGTGLIQHIRKLAKPAIPIKAIQRNLDKLTRAMDGIPYVASGKVYIPADAKFTLDFITEILEFSADMTHKNDDQVDTMLDAIDIAFSPKKKEAGTW